MYTKSWFIVFNFPLYLNLPEIINMSSSTVKTLCIPSAESLIFKYFKIYFFTEILLASVFPYVFQNNGKLVHSKDFIIATFPPGNLFFVPLIFLKEMKAQNHTLYPDF